MGGNAITVIAKYSNLAACRDFSAKMVKVNNLPTKGRAKMVLQGMRVNLHATE